MVNVVVAVVVIVVVVVIPVVIVCYGVYSHHVLICHRISIVDIWSLFHFQYLSVLLRNEGVIPFPCILVSMIFDLDLYDQPGQAASFQI